MFGVKIRRHHILHPNTIIPLIISRCIYTKEAGPKCLKEGQNPPIPVHIAINILSLVRSSYVIQPCVISINAVCVTASMVSLAFGNSHV